MVVSGQHLIYNRGPGLQDSCHGYAWSRGRSVLPSCHCFCASYLSDVERLRHESLCFTCTGYSQLVILWQLVHTYPIMKRSHDGLNVQLWFEREGWAVWHRLANHQWNAMKGAKVSKYNNLIWHSTYREWQWYPEDPCNPVEASVSLWQSGSGPVQWLCNRKFAVK